MADSLLEISKTCSSTSARTGILHLPRGDVATPVFMPVGTRASVRTLASEEVTGLGYGLILANTFHLLLRPGHERIRALGGLQKFMNWPGSILTDSGGYQVFSLSSMRKITEEGAAFASPIDGAKVFLSPELSAEVQAALGSDIVMAFDECIPYPADRAYAAEATARSTRWTGRSQDRLRELATGQLFFGICQGGMDDQLRRQSADSMVELDCDGYAVGGLSVGEPFPEMMAMLEVSTAALPEDRPRYMMGVGMPSDIVASVARGVDMFDCVLPTLMARHATLFTEEGRLRIRNARFGTDPSPIEEGCPCPACKGGYSRAYLHHLFKAGELLGPRLASLHNLSYYGRLMEQIREAINGGSFGAMCAAWKRRKASEA